MYGAWMYLRWWRANLEAAAMRLVANIKWDPPKGPPIYFG